MRVRRARSALVVAALVGGLTACTSGGAANVGPSASPASTAPSSKAPSSNASSVAPSGGPAAAPAALGAKWPLATSNTFAAYLRQLAGGPTFYELQWCDIEPRPGQFDWTTTDAVARTAQRVGAHLMLKLRIGTCWATGGRGGHERGAKKPKSASAMPTDMAAYTAFVRAVVQRYAPYGVHEYAIENEVDSPSMWVDSANAYVSLATAAAAAIRAADPRATVADAGISSPAYGDAIAAQLLAEGRTTQAVQAYDAYYSRRFDSGHPAVQSVAELRSQLGTADAGRNLAFLAAVRTLVQRHVVDVVQLHFYERYDNVPALLQYLRSSVGPTVPIEAWEVGMFGPGANQSDAELRDEVTKTVALLLAGGVRKVIWLPLSAPDGNKRYGLVAPDGSVRPAGVAFARIKQLSDAATAYPVPGGKLSGVVLAGRGRTTVLAWSDGGTTVAGSWLQGATVGDLTAAGTRQEGGVRVGSAPVVISTPATAAQTMRDLASSG